MIEIDPPRPVDDAALTEIVNAHGVPRPLAALLLARGQEGEIAQRLSTTVDDWKALLLDPAPMKGFETAVQALLEARERRETVVIHGDYDVDGMTGTAVLHLALRRAGLNCGWTLPRRDGEGYGLSDASLERCRNVGDVFGLPEGASRTASWAISVDTGITAGPQIQRARERGLRTIVTDHHLPGEGFPDQAEIVIDPYQDGCPYPNKALCGAGLAWKLGCEMLRRTGKAQDSDPFRLLQLVALGTLADMVPLTLENMALVRLGLRELAERPLPGVVELLRSADISGSYPKSTDLVFRVTPRLNSAGRLRQGETAVKLLLASGAPEAAQGMAELEDLNHQRQQLDQRITAEAQTQAERFLLDDPAALVLAHESWHEGVSGIVAQRVAERVHRPVFVLAPDPGRPGEYRGSGRTIRGVDLHECLAECAGLLEKWGGHSQAAGLSIREENIPAFRERFAMAARLTGAGTDAPHVRTDARMELSEITPELLGWMERLEPWGATNDAPCFLCTDVELQGLSRVGDGRHLRVTLEKGGVRFEAIGFGLAAQAEDIAPGRRVQIAFQPEWNTFRGRKTLQLKLKGIR